MSLLIASSEVLSDTAQPGAVSTSEGIARRVRPRSPLAVNVKPGDRRILLVDDDQAVLHLMETILVTQGYCVHSCGNAEQALRDFQRKPEINLLLTDINMPPGVDGLELATRITRMKPLLPVVVMSGAALSEGQERLIRESSWSFMNKPLSVSRLLSVVSILIRGFPAQPSGTSIPITKIG